MFFITINCKKSTAERFSVFKIGSVEFSVTK